MNEKKIVFPIHRYMDCFGGLYEAIASYLTEGNAEYIILGYLSKCKVIFEVLDIEDVQVKYGKDPWDFQFIRVVNEKEDILFNQITSRELLNLGLNKLNISYETFCSKTICLEEFLIENFDKYYILLQVDSYYLPVSPCYQRVHGSHYLMVLNFNCKNRKVKFYETVKGINELDVKIIERCINERIRYGNHYLVSDKTVCKSYYKKTAIDRIKFIRLWTDFINSFSSVPHFLRLNFNQHPEETEYIYIAFSQILLFQISPIIRLRSSMFDKSKVGELHDEWTILENFTIKERARKIYSVDKLIGMINKILLNENAHYDSWA